MQPKGKDDYELVPSNQIEYLRHEVEKLKRNPFGDTEDASDILSELAQLNRNIRELLGVFQTASDEIVRDYKDSSGAEKINRLLDQNERLAKGMVTIAELLKEMKGGKAASSPQPNPEPAATLWSAPPEQAFPAPEPRRAQPAMPQPAAAPPQPPMSGFQSFAPPPAPRASPQGFSGPLRPVQPRSTNFPMGEDNLARANWQRQGIRPEDVPPPPE